MIPASFEYLRASTIEEALSLLEEHGDDAKLLAGGHSLLPAMKLRLATPSYLIDIGRIDSLKSIEEANGRITIGAMVTHRQLESADAITSQVPDLARAAAGIGDPQVRNLGTLGGSVAHADPASDYPAVLLSADATIVIQGRGGQRSIASEDFFIDLFMTELEEGELITAVQIPSLPPATGATYLKFPHPASRFAVVGCAARVSLHDGSCADVRVAFNGISGAAFRDAGVESALIGQAPSEAAIEFAAGKAAIGAEPMGDAFASAEYRGHLAKVFARRALREAIDAAGVST